MGPLMLVLRDHLRRDETKAASEVLAGEAGWPRPQKPPRWRVNRRALWLVGLRAEFPCSSAS
jgi:hypothetical protein